MKLKREMTGKNSGGVREGDHNHKWRLPLRAAAFLTAIEFSERLSYFGIAMNLTSYLTGVLDQDLKTAAKMSNYWGGVTAITPLVGAFLADAYTGRFTMIMVSSLIYFMGLSLLTMLEFIPILKPCKVFHACNHHQKKVHEVAFFLALYMLSLATGGLKLCLESFGADQFDDDDHFKERKGFNWWTFGFGCGIFLGATFVIYQQDIMGWGIANLTLTVTLGFSIIIFYFGKSVYRYRIPEGSPLTKVEETKLLLNMFPIWLTCLIFGICMAQTSTFFVDQSSTMNRVIGHGFEIPPAAVFSLSSIVMLCSVTFYEKVVVPVLRRTTGNQRGISILQRIGTGMVFTVVAMATAALVERKRLAAAEKEVIEGKRNMGPLPMSVFWLAPQDIIIGIADSFILAGLQEYFYDHMPDSMRSLGMVFYLTVIGVGSFVSSLLVKVVEHIGGRSWIGDNLNSSCLDKFYWLLTAVGVVNWVIFLFIARRSFSDKDEHRNIIDAVDGDEETKTLIRLVYIYGAFYIKIVLLLVTSFYNGVSG